MGTIKDIHLKEEEFPLTKPYVLSFGTLYHFTSMQVEVELVNGNRQCAEVVPLVGYNNETPEVIAGIHQHLKKELPGKTLTPCGTVSRGTSAQTPISISPCTSFRMASFHSGHWTWRSCAAHSGWKMSRPICKCGSII